MKQRHKGFTIVELLVVISIIGLLSSIAAVALGNARKQARDNRRIQDLKQIQTALELYYKDNKKYPLSAANTENKWAGHCTGPGGTWPATDDYILGLEPNYIGNIPVDPRFDTDGPVNAQCYAYQAKQISGQWHYKLWAFGVMESVCDGTDVPPDTIPDPGDDCNPQYFQVLDDPSREEATIMLSSTANY